MTILPISPATPISPAPTMDASLLCMLIEEYMSRPRPAGATLPAATGLLEAIRQTWQDATAAMLAALDEEDATAAA